MKLYKKSKKLENVCYDIRGPVLKEAKRLEEEGYNILKLNIGNPAVFDLEAPDELLHDVVVNIRKAQAYCDSKGLFPARKAVMQYSQRKGIPDVEVEDIYIGNGVSELIVMSMQSLLNDHDEVLVPMPDYPLWSAAVNLAGGRPVYYRCDEESDWNPDMADLRAKVSDKTRAIVVINPNNPTGALYPRDILEEIVTIAAEHHLVVMADEIYDKILYEGAVHTSIASLSEDVLFFTFSGLSKNYRAAGFRSGWLIISGNKSAAGDLVEGLDMLSNMRLCSNVPSQFSIQSSLGGYQSIEDLVAPGGRLREQRDFSYRKLNEIPGVSCVKPKGGLYLFPKIDLSTCDIRDDQQLVYDFLVQEKVLLVQGSGFNWPEPNHVRFVFLARNDIMGEAIDRFAHFLSHYSQ